MEEYGTLKRYRVNLYNNGNYLATITTVAFDKSGAMEGAWSIFELDNEAKIIEVMEMEEDINEKHTNK